MTVPALAQTNPTVAACGLPTEGTIWATVTYTLTADCVQTGLISIVNATPPKVVTINGGGYTITGGSSDFIRGSGTLNLNDLTLDGQNVERIQPIHVDTLNLNRVTVTRFNSGPALSTSTGSLNNVLLSWNSSGTLSLGGNGTAVHAGPTTSHTWNNVVMHNNLGRGGAISLRAGASLTTNGCLTLSGNAPYDVYAPDGTTWTDNSTGACSGTIGNGGQAPSTPSLMACGFPAAGNLDTSATYRLKADCQLSGVYYISEDVDIRIIGNARALRASCSDSCIITAASSSLHLENVALEGIRIFNWGDIRGQHIRVSGSTTDFVFNVGEARFSNALFTGNTAGSASGRSVALAYNAYQRGFTSFSDSTFRDNSGGLGLLATFGAVIELKGCIHFENNAPVDTYIYPGQGGTVNDNRASNCDQPITDPLIQPAVTSAQAIEAADAKEDINPPPPTATPGFRQTLSDLPPAITVRNWVVGAQGQRVGADGVGRQDLIARGIRDAVDMWGYITPGTEVCFEQAGRIVFLDAAYSPRRLVDLTAFRRDGQTCTTIDRAGTVVLLDGTPVEAECQLTTRDVLNLRATPVDGTIIGLIAAGRALRAIEQRDGYYRVNLDGRDAWVSAEYVSESGDC